MKIFPFRIKHHLFVGSEVSKRDRDIKMRSFFFQMGGRKRNDHLAVVCFGRGAATVFDRRGNAVARFFDCLVRKADNRERMQPLGEVGFNIDEVRVRVRRLRTPNASKGHI
jgi:hypothetical protein